MKLTAPRSISFLVAAGLYVLALCAHFGVIHLSRDMPTWAWIIGYGLLLAACFFRGL